MNLEWVFPAALLEIDAVCAAIQAQVADCCEADRFALQLLARESLNNAVLHGSGLDPALRVRCQLWREGAAVCLRVSDEGPGFDWRAVQARAEVAQDKEEGRGLVLYRLYASQVIFNDSGSSVTLIRPLQDPEGSRLDHPSSATRKGAASSPF